MPRRKKYETAAERQAAYRARKQQQQENVTGDDYQVNVTHNLVVWRQPAGYELLREVVKVATHQYPDGRVMARLETRKFPPSSVATETHIHVCPSECRRATDEDIERLAMQEVSNRNVADVTFDLCYCRTPKPIKLIAWLESIGFVQTDLDRTWEQDGTIQMQKGHMRLLIDVINEELGIIRLCDGCEDLTRLLGL